MTHHHHPGHSHPPAPVLPSLLRMSAAVRLATAALTLVVIWAAVWWALQ